MFILGIISGLMIITAIRERYSEFFIGSWLELSLYRDHQVNVFPAPIPVSGIKVKVVRSCPFCLSPFDSPVFARVVTTPSLKRYHKESCRRSAGLSLLALPSGVARYLSTKLPQKCPVTFFTKMWKALFFSSSPPHPHPLRACARARCFRRSRFCVEKRGGCEQSK